MRTILGAAFATLLALEASAVATTGQPVVAAPVDSYASCRERLARSPGEYESAYCFYQVTLEQRLWDEGVRVFDELIARDPGNTWLVVAYAHVYRARNWNPVRAEALYRQAAEAFRKGGHAAGEVTARANLRTFFELKGRAPEAQQEVTRIKEIGAQSTDALVRAQAWVAEAAHVQDTGGDLGVAYGLLKRAESALPAGSSYLLERSLLISLGLASFRMGRLDEALGLYERLERLATAKAEPLVIANARFNRLNTLSIRETLLPSAGARPRLLQLARESLATAIAAQNQDITIKSHRAIAELLGADATRRDEALEHADACVRLAITARQPNDEAICAWLQASLVLERAPRAAREAQQRALDATVRANSPRTDTYSAGSRMRLSWTLNPREQAVADSLAAIDAIETLRRLQATTTTSAELFSTWTSDYYWLSGRLLQVTPEPMLDQAFAITERMRARALLDTLEQSRLPRDPAHPAMQAHRDVLQAIAAVQRALMNPSLADAERRARLAELSVLELREQDAERQVAAAFSQPGRASPTFATIPQLQAALADDEALLSYQIGLWETSLGEFGGGSWLVTLTRGSRAISRLPDRARLEPVVPVFAGLLERGGGAEGAAAVRLYRDLLANALGALPPGITRLIIVADGALHHLPFEALRASAQGAPLGATFELVTVPSATVWWQWRSRAVDTIPRVLTLADPDLGDDGRAAAPTRSAMLFQGLRLGRLPHAREESRSIERHVGAVDALIGGHASEAAFKARDLRRYGILHFAAHAVADEAHPERSAVLLAPGDGREDGLLQAREIAALDLAGRVVVLSACQTAAGAVLSGEGVLSLARAFFQAGAHAVIGSRWPLRDEDAAALFDGFYRHLATGTTLAEALKATVDQARADGRSASAWAALVLLGDGQLRPFPGGRVETNDGATWPTATLVAGLVLLLLSGFVVGWRHR